MTSTAESSSSSHSKFSHPTPTTIPSYAACLGQRILNTITWMATDSVVLRELIGGRDDRSYWLCGTSIRKNLETFLLGDRILFHPPFESVHQGPPIALRAQYLTEVANRTAGRMLWFWFWWVTETREGVFVIGDEDNSCRLSELELEVAVHRTKANVWLINTVC